MLRISTIVALLAATAVVCGWTAPSGLPTVKGLQDRTSHANDSYFGVIDSIRSSSSDIGSAGERAVVHSIRVRYDDRSHQTVVQAGLDGLVVGNGVRIEQGRVQPY